MRSAARSRLITPHTHSPTHTPSLTHLPSFFLHQGFATSISIVISCVVSIYLFGFVVTRTSGGWHACAMCDERDDLLRLAGCMMGMAVLRAAEGEMRGQLAALRCFLTTCPCHFPEKFGLGTAMVIGATYMYAAFAVSSVCLSIPMLVIRRDHSTRLDTCSSALFGVSHLIFLRSPNSHTERNSP